MEARLQPCLQLPMPHGKLTDIITKAKDWALMHGACMRSKTDFSPDSLTFAPFTLLPSTLPRTEFHRAVSLQTSINELMHKVAHDHEFLEESLKMTIAVDNFTARLYEIYETVRNEGYAQSVSLGVLRSDYLCHFLQSNCIKQVEVNSIAASFGAIATQVALLHRFVLRELGLPDMIKNIPENHALEGISSGMLEAWQIFGDKQAVILFIVENVTINICDQRFLEYEIKRLNPEVQVVRKTLTEVGDLARLGKNKELLMGEQTVSVIYFRAGYEPGHYMSEKEWGARLLMERSTAIKCPSIQYHLAGTKKVQQTLAKSGSLERYFKDVEKLEAVRSIFTGLYSLDPNKDGDESIKKALVDPQNYVLKPQREGGGNNLYGDDIKSMLLSIKDTKERSAWILMDRIHPPVQANYIVRSPYPVESTQDIVGELGIFGVVIGDEKSIKINKQVGFMLRSKSNTSDEAGVAAGSGVLDSPYLI